MKKRIFLSLSFLILGSLVYLMFDLEVISKSNFIYRFIRNYVPDMCWILSFFLTSINFTRNIAKNDLLMNSLYVLGIGILLEIFQYFNIVKGIFDFFDVLVYIIAVILACSLEIFLRRNKNEEIL